ncbi:MAG: hypothetical protein KDA75_02125 [Planctomycetaceae bacterium]|nr:hypothetical protein [Planctomycetaceae bacterium]
MTYEALALLLMIVGFALIVMEVFIPSGGMILILCVVAFASSVWCAYKAWWGVSDGYFWAFVAALVVLIPGATVASFRLLERSPMGRRVILSGPSQAEVTPHQEEVSRLTALIGRHGESLTLMTPGGMVSVDGKRLHAESEGMLISAGRPIEVIGVKGTRVLVREAADAASRDGLVDSGVSSQDARPEEESSTPLDFDFPQG